MGIQDEIEEKLRQGYTPQQLTDMGYKRSTIYKVNNTIIIKISGSIDAITQFISGIVSIEWSISILQIDLTGKSGVSAEEDINNAIIGPGVNIRGMGFDYYIVYTVTVDISSDYSMRNGMSLAQANSNCRSIAYTLCIVKGKRIETFTNNCIIYFPYIV